VRDRPRITTFDRVSHRLLPRRLGRARYGQTGPDHRINTAHPLAVTAEASHRLQADDQGLDVVRVHVGSHGSGTLDLGEEVGHAGVGFETAKVLAARGASVVLAVRDVGRGKQAAAQITASVADADVRVQR
jgi:hypothetical protein